MWAFIPSPSFVALHFEEALTEYLWKRHLSSIYPDTHAEINQLLMIYNRIYDFSSAHFVFKSLKKAYVDKWSALFGGVKSDRFSSSVQP